MSLKCHQRRRLEMAETITNLRLNGFSIEVKEDPVTF
jgi:hypothetical protein